MCVISLRGLSPSVDYMPLQDDQDKANSEMAHTKLRSYMKWKSEADMNLAQRTAFKWTILRPGELSNAPGIGKASIGRTHLSPAVSVSAPLVTTITNVTDWDILKAR